MAITTVRGSRDEQGAFLLVASNPELNPDSRAWSGRIQRPCRRRGSAPDLECSNSEQAERNTTARRRSRGITATCLASLRPAAPRKTACPCERRRSRSELPATDAQSPGSRSRRPDHSKPASSILGIGWPASGRGPADVQPNERNGYRSARHGDAGPTHKRWNSAYRSLELRSRVGAGTGMPVGRSARSRQRTAFSGSCDLRLNRQDRWRGGRDGGRRPC